ncbi:hypothetical protein AB7W75_12135 [Providencia huaxiensis]|uniref:hypothetical protein n=1 Tax=Enterobacterales TaxID=91347 RepID=UPI0005B2FEDA|nr:MULTISPECIES: hypothetical protein [Enterobacterales]ELR5188717.1 hypothetical protein [Providencia rettgeri]MBG5985080.1 hypothetical protein [Proteus vulgaris]MBJ9972471.1 hypothetical protein [Providencia rettgeri]MDH2323742.1 hypothetical protein [Providencia rettgeri]MDS0789428.1 hypothetical protein [Proteus vulgaris]
MSIEAAKAPSESGLFGTKIPAPGSLYWFNVSLLFLVVAGMNALADGAFPSLFICFALFGCAVYGWLRPLTNGEQRLVSVSGFLCYAGCMWAIMNIQQHVLHEPIGFTGTMCVVLSSFVGFYLGRYTRIGRFSLKPLTEE